MGHSRMARSARSAGMRFFPHCQWTDCFAAWLLGQADVPKDPWPAAAKGLGVRHCLWCGPPDGNPFVWFGALGCPISWSLTTSCVGLEEQHFHEFNGLDLQTCAKRTITVNRLRGVLQPVSSHRRRQSVAGLAARRVTCCEGSRSLRSRAGR
jgi:hypothetical protein